MREILFRGKRADNGEWVYGDLVHSKTTSRGVITEIYSLEFTYEVLPETVCEYTGLTDKNGNKIFEGDICPDKENVYEIIFERYQFSVKVIKTPLYLIKNGDTFPLWQFDNCERNGYRQLEIIGNIYDNPELIK